MADRRVLPPTWFAVALVVMVVLHFLVPIARFIAPPWTWTGLVPVVMGAWLNAAGSRLFDRAGTTVKPFEESTQLVVSGPYRFTRNPMYLGMVLILAGLGILLGSVGPFVVVPSFIAILHTRFIVHEEAALRARFPDDWATWSARVRRWL